MTTQALYNKWRGQTFDDILGQEHITRTLRNQIGAGRIGHAYLFTGVRGTGKTSTARILAKAINCLGETDEPPCNQCRICTSITRGASLDLIEIDAASNRGIDEIRDLRDRVNFAPNECRYKVYVIDEVHMLTREAHNALLKTLEEPPNHVVFVLCTTEPHRLPDTVLSRCQRFDFRRGSVQTIVANLEHICSAEGIAITPNALDFVARRAGGSYRDAVSLLDQLAAYGSDTITLEQVQQILGTVPTDQVTALLRSLFRGDLATGLHVIDQALDQGAEPSQFLGDILEQLRALMLLQIEAGDRLTRFTDETLADLRSLAADDTISLARIVGTIKLFSDAQRGLRTAARPQLPIEIALVEAVVGAPSEAPSDAPPAPAAAPVAPTSAATEVVAAATVRADAPPASVPEACEPVAGQTEAPPPVLTLDWVRAKWRQVRYRVRALDSATEGLVNSASPIEVQGNILRLGSNKFVCEKLSDPKRRSLLEDVLAEVLGMPARIECVACDLGQLPPSSDGEPTQPAELFTPGAQDAARDALLNHPAVREARRRGGQVSQINVKDQQEDRRG